MTSPEQHRNKAPEHYDPVMSAPVRTPSLAGSIIKSVLFMLLCGIVGPIFLVLSFVLDVPFGAADWLRPVGIGVTALMVAIGVFLGVWSYRRRAKKHRLATTGRVARGDVLAIEPTNMMVNNQPMIRLALRIHGPGVQPFEVDVKRVIPIALTGMLHRGVVGVYVDPATQEFEIDWQLTGLLSGSMPTIFTDSATGREYDLTGQTDVILQVMEILQRHGVQPQSMTDLRNNPAARAEIMRLAHTHGRDPSAPPGHPQQSAQHAPQSSTADRLAELDQIWGRGLLSEAEYHESRARILGGL